MKLIRTEDAEGQVLCHDITQIIPGVVKDAVFRKGHIVTKEDIPVLLSVGKEHLYVWEKKEGILHEDEAAQVLRDICINEYMSATQPKEGKIEILADCEGLLKVNTERLNAVNGLGELMIATVHGNFPVKKGDKIAATRIIPLVIEEEKMKLAKKAARFYFQIHANESGLYKVRTHTSCPNVLVLKKIQQNGVQVVGLDHHSD